MDIINKRKAEGERLENLLAVLRLSPTAFFREMKEYTAQGNTILRQIKNGKAGISKKMLISIQNTYPQVNPNYLKHGIKPMLKDKEVTVFRSATVPNGKPYYSQNGMALNYASMNEWKAETNLTFHVPIFDCDFYMDVIGETMHPRIKKGDVIACKHKAVDTEFIYGRVYHISTAHESFLYRVLKSDDEEAIKLVPENSKFGEIELKRYLINQVFVVTGCCTTSV